MEKIEEGVCTYQNSDEDVVMISAPADTSDNQPSGDEMLSPGLTNNLPSGDEVLSPGLTNTHDLMTVPVLSTEQSISTSTSVEEAVLPISPSTAEDEVMISPPADTSNKYPSIIVQLNDKSGDKVSFPIVTDTHDRNTVPVLSTDTVEDEVMISPPTDTSDKYPSTIVQLNDKPHEGPPTQNISRGTECDNIKTIEQLVSILRREEKKSLVNCTAQKVSGNTITVSKFEGLNLNQYSLAKAENCRQYHAVCKSGCKKMVDAANYLLQKNWIPLPKLWRTCFSLKRYDCDKAQRRLLQMPVACIRLKNGVVVIEKNSDNCYHGVISEINQIYDMLPLTDNVKKEDPIRKDECQDLLKSATSTSEVQKIKHVIASTHNMSQREAQRLGIRRLKQRAAQVEDATETVKNIKSKHNYFAKLEQKAFLHTHGLDFELYLSSDSSDSSEWESEDEEVVEIKEKPSSHTLSASLDIEERLEKL
ncbi:Hypothetical predicted protein [Paramuricea clavata]|uniref:Uncharacterized protein n=1 Tax=Paramuricea clavata TaxID=317549 RepID=A0A7D9E6L0_PARCT|nr:Hypothetical predicted protein [Paramuricea clavata]